jgi:hypothetical protein
VQGDNAQALGTEDQIVIAAEVTPSSADFGQLRSRAPDTSHDRVTSKSRIFIR